MRDKYLQQLQFLQKAVFHHPLNVPDNHFHQYVRDGILQLGLNLLEQGLEQEPFQHQL